MEAGRRRGREASFDEGGHIHMEAVCQRLDGPKRTKKIAELEVWVFRELSPRLGAQNRVARDSSEESSERRPDRAPAVRVALRRVARLRGREWAGYARRYPVPTGLWGGHVHLTYTQVGRVTVYFSYPFGVHFLSDTYRIVSQCILSVS